VKLGTVGAVRIGFAGRQNSTGCSEPDYKVVPLIGEGRRQDDKHLWRLGKRFLLIRLIDKRFVSKTNSFLEPHYSRRLNLLCERCMI